jgi:SAM-dependent methyltransferase
MTRALYSANRLALTPGHRLLLNPLNRLRYSRRPFRQLEIGPGAQTIDGFETVNIVSGRNVDYVANAASRLPFDDCTFDIVYASHVIEHIAWYQVEDVVREWARIIKPGGKLEVWTPDGLKISKAFVEAEEEGSAAFHQDGWWAYNEAHDPCKWAAGRYFSYGDGTGYNHPNWHKAVFSPRYLKALFASVGLIEIRELNRSEIRGYDHGWINLGICGTKTRAFL